MEQDFKLTSTEINIAIYINISTFTSVRPSIGVRRPIPSGTF